MNELEHLISSLTEGHNLSDILLLFMLVFTRWLAFTIMIPIFGALLLPSIVRIALAGLMSIVSVIVLAQGAFLLAPTNIFLVTALFIKEALIGFIIGFLASLIFFAYELAGQLIDIARGASMAKMLVPELKIQSSPMGTLFFQLALVIFLALGLHRELITNLFLSFEIFPAFSLAIDLKTINPFVVATKILASLFGLSLRFSMPVIFICFLIDLAFGLMNRVAPQINAYFLSLPAKIIGGLVMLFFSLPFLIDDFLEHYRELTLSLFQ